MKNNTNYIKRFFIMPFILLSAVACLHSVFNIFQQPKDIAWWGALIATLPMNVFIAYLMLSKQGRAAGKLHLGLCCAVLGLILSIVFFSDGLAVIYAGLVGVIGILLYDYWYTPLGREQNTPLKVGESLPSFVLKNVHGDIEDIDSWKGKPFFLMFVRGNWCPLCVAQVSEMAAIYRDIADKGVDIKIIAAQAESDTKKLAARFDVPMQFYVDNNKQVAKQLKLLHKNGVGAGLIGYEADTYYPTIVLCDRDLKIVYADLTDNYRQRPDPSVLQAIVNDKF